MKTKPTKIDRSGAKWLPGAMALAATAASSQAATVQITLSGNKISSTSAGGNSLNADLTGDGELDYSLGDNQMVQPGVAGLFLAPSVGYVLAGGGAGSYGARAAFSANAAVGDIGLIRGAGIQSATALNPITFSDIRINGGLITGAWVEVHAFNSSPTSHTVDFTRLIFDDASTTRPAFTSIPGVRTEWGVSAVPEPSGFLATSLLLGAAGLIRRRQARAA
jgi:hypothetical protein